MAKFKQIINIILLLTLFVNCSDSKLQTPETEGERLQILYSNAMDLVNNKDYVDAAILFEDIERQYPYSKCLTNLS